MNLDHTYLNELGFVEFIHLRKTDRDGKKRMAWMQVVNNKIVTIRIVLLNEAWIVDYVSPDKYAKKLSTINDAIEFMKS